MIVRPLFKRCSTPKYLSDAVSGANKIYCSGEILFTNKYRRVRLGNRLSAGGEGTIYDCLIDGQEMVAKIYHPHHRFLWRRDKLLLMTSKDLSRLPIAAPCELLYDELRRFVGIIMPKAIGVPLSSFCFHIDLLRQRMPQWNRRHLVYLCYRIALSVLKLHQAGIILGDIHPGNILVNADTSITWIDVDSFQIEAYPCVVGTERFRAPELECDLSHILRTHSHDVYALSVLIFMILGIGLSPYSIQGEGGDMKQLAKRGILPYSFQHHQAASSYYPPDTPGRYAWSYMPMALRNTLGINLTGHAQCPSIPRTSAKMLVRCLYQYCKDLLLEGCRAHPMHGALILTRPCPNKSLIQLMRPNLCVDCKVRFWESPQDIQRRSDKGHPRILCPFCIRRRTQLNRKIHNDT